MEVIVNNQTPLTVKDQDGNILFQWLPQTLKLKKMTDEEMEEFVKMISSGKGNVLG